MSSLNDLKMRAFIADGFVGSLNDMSLQFFTALVAGTGITQVEIDQLKNINATTISEAQWAIVGAGVEATFIPLWTSATGSGTVTYTANAGEYQRVGNWVTFELTMRTSSIASRTGVVTLTGLPIAAQAGRDQSVYVGFATNLNITANQSLSGYVLGGSSTIKLQLWDSAVGQTPLDASEWSDNGFITVSGSYKV